MIEETSPGNNHYGIREDAGPATGWMETEGDRQP